jgi:transcriptional regulator with XRE-family HTH domain
MSVSDPPVVSGPLATRRLASELRARRDRAGLTIGAVAGRLEWSPAKISRIENARVRVLPRDVKALLRAYGITEPGQDWDYLLKLARAPRRHGWWQAHSGTLTECFRTYAALEADALALWAYESDYVPGLLQTGQYARAVLAVGLLTGQDTELHVAARMARQQHLAGADPPQVHAVLSEAVLRRPVGGTSVMKGQLDWLAEAGRQPHVTVQVLPFSVGAHPGMDGAFTILKFPGPADPDLVYASRDAGTVFAEQPGQRDRCTHIFGCLRAAALPPGASQDLISQISAKLATASG